jgi:Tfp pilus assembly protein PilV
LKTGNFRDKTTPRTTAGYVLLETLVAVVVLSIGIVYLSRALIVPLRASKACLQYVRAAEIATAKLEETRLGPLELGSLSGEIEDSSTDYRWQVEISQQSDMITMLTATVTWNVDESERRCESTMPVFNAMTGDTEQSDTAEVDREAGKLEPTDDEI